MARYRWFNRSLVLHIQKFGRTYLALSMTILVLLASAGVLLAGDSAVATVSSVQEHGSEAAEPSFWMVFPFVLLLVLIATGPIFYAHHWHHHYPKYAIGLGAFTTFLYLFVLGNPSEMLHVLHEYISFIALLASLFIASGGILLKIRKEGTPMANVGLLTVGAVISNLIGTTGASMLLIRPYMRLNRGRIKAYHIVFFIFIVSNVGGALTPIGDPPLFLGFLRGVPFFWTLTHVWYIWIPTVVILLGIFYVLDKRNHDKVVDAVSEAPELKQSGRPIEIVGGKNFIWLGVVIASVFLDPNVSSAIPSLHIGSFHLPFGIREVIMFTVCYLSFRYASKEALKGNDFSFEPIREVAWLFIGIFATMVPALELIRNFATQNADQLGLSMFYWGTGSLSGILDNAPTYVSFLTAAMGKFGLDVNLAADVTAFALNPESWHFLQAISVAAVFFGAMTYIGNGPNFMVKAIAEADGVDCPSFGGYVARYSLPVLLPTYFVVWIIFYSGWIL